MLNRAHLLNPRVQTKGVSPEKLGTSTVRTSEDKFMSHYISRKVGLRLASTETRTGRESYKLMRRTVRRGRFLPQEEKKTKSQTNFEKNFFFS